MHSDIVEQAINTPLPDKDVTASASVPMTTTPSQLHALNDEHKDIFFDVTEGRYGLDATLLSRSQKKALRKATQLFFDQSPQGISYYASLEIVTDFTKVKFVSYDKNDPAKVGEYLTEMFTEGYSLGYLEEMVDQANKIAKGRTKSLYKLVKFKFMYDANTGVPSAYFLPKILDAKSTRLLKIKQSHCDACGISHTILRSDPTKCPDFTCKVCQTAFIDSREYRAHQRSKCCNAPAASGDDVEAVQEKAVHEKTMDAAKQPGDVIKAKL